MLKKVFKCCFPTNQDSVIIRNEISNIIVENNKTTNYNNYENYNETKEEIEQGPVKKNLNLNLINDDLPIYEKNKSIEKIKLTTNSNISKIEAKKFKSEKFISKNTDEVEVKQIETNANSENLILNKLNKKYEKNILENGFYNNESKYESLYKEVKNNESNSENEAENDKSHDIIESIIEERKKDEEIDSNMYNDTQKEKIIAKSTKKVVMKSTLLNYEKEEENQTQKEISELVSNFWGF